MLRPAFLLLIFVPALCLAQKVDKRIVKGLQTDIGFLTSDAGTARSVGSEGERKAADYLVSRYEKLKIPPYAAGYRHPFSFVHGLEMNDSRIVLGGQSGQLGGDAFPLPFSSNGEVSGDVLIEVQEQGAIWLLPLYEDAKQAADPKFDWQSAAWAMAKQAAKDGATGVVFFDSYGTAAAQRFDPLCKLQTLKIPVAFVGKKQWQELSSRDATMVSVTLDIRLSKPERKGTNVVAYIDNKAAQTIVIAASFDQEGNAEGHASGANDNASGTAALLQLAEALKRNRLRNYNVVLAHLSGSRMGQAGAAAFESEIASGNEHVAAMIDLFMIGRLSDPAPELLLRTTADFPEQDAIHALLKKAGFREAPFTARCGGTDSRIFEDVRIPTMVMAGQSCETGADDPKSLNYAAEARLVATLGSLLQLLSARLQH